MKLAKQQPQNSRTGFTIIELLVTVSIIAVLMSLILPAIQSARESARRIQCANRVRNVGIGILNRTEAHRRFPAAAQMGPRSAANPSQQPQPYRNWVVDLLPWLDRKDLADRWRNDLPSTAPANRELSSVHLDVLVCPSDFTVVGSGGNLSYSVNGGIGDSVYIAGIFDFPVDPFHSPIDLNGNGDLTTVAGPDGGSPTDRDMLKASGLFFAENRRISKDPVAFGLVQRHHTPASVSDGLSNTLMVTENIRTGADPATGADWATTETRRSRVYFSHRVCDGNECSEGNINYARANAGAHAINAGVHQSEGVAPWPSSGHPGGVNVIFADGHLSFLSEDVDGAVYAAMFSPAERVMRTTPLRQSP